MSLRLLSVLALSPALALATGADTDVPDTSPADPAAAHLAFAASLEACAAASHQSPHPFVRDFVVEHQISGIEDGHCVYSQTMPGGMSMQCRMDEPARVGLAAEFRELAEGRMVGGTGEQPAWAGSCEVVTADGERLELDQG